MPAHLLIITALGLRHGRGYSQYEAQHLKYSTLIFALTLIIGLAASLFVYFGPVIGLVSLLALKLRRYEILIFSALTALLLGLDLGVDTESLTTSLATLAGSAITTLLLYLFWSLTNAALHTLKLKNPAPIKIGIRILASWLTAIAAMIFSLFFVA